MSQNRLFIACIISLVTTSFGFIIRAFLLTEWGKEFNLSESQLGSIQGVGLYPFALSIILFSLVIDKLGYGRTMALAWICHMASAIITITATSYTALYLGTFIFALANGAIEAAINPVTATLFPNKKTHYLNILHAGWPGGLVLGGVLTICMSGIDLSWAWRLKMGLFIIPTLLYGVLLLGQKFPTQERVTAGISYKEMLSEFGWVGCLVCCFFVAYAIDEIMLVFQSQLSSGWIVGITIIPTAVFFTKIKSPGRPVFIFLLLVMILGATTEVGTDSWIAALMTPILSELSQNAGNWVLVYTSFIMFTLRFFAGPIVQWISPLGLLFVCSAIACIGLYSLSVSTTAVAIFIAASFYGVGKSFFWPTMLGVVSEQFPKGGALTLNAIAGVGMLAVGVIGGPLLGTIQDKYLDSHLKTEYPSLHARIAEDEQSKFGIPYQPLNKNKISLLIESDKRAVETIRKKNNQSTLAKVAILPLGMFFCYLGLIIYYKKIGGYKVKYFN